MKRIASGVLVLMMALVMCTSMALADPAQSLDDIVNQPKQSTSQNTQSNTQNTQGNSQTTTQGNTNSGKTNSSRVQEEAKGFIGDLGEASDMSDANETVAKAAEPLQRVVSILVQLISYVITFGLTLRVVLDLAYIAVPFLRNILANGHVGNPQTGANTLGAPGMGPMGGMGSMGGMGGYGGGMGRYGGGAGMGMGYGGSMGMGGMGAMGGMNLGGGNTNVGANDMGSRLGKTQWVSNAALNAVAAETTVGPDGKPQGPYRTYFKDMLVIMIITPILLILAVTGTLTNLGFMLGDLICKGINNLGGMM